MGVKETDTRKRRSHRWIWIASAVSTLLLLPAGCVAWAAYSFSESTREQPVDCGKALDYAWATLPRSARDAHCTAMHWQDTYVEAQFRMPAAEVAGWVAGSYPAAQASSYEEGLHVSYPPKAGWAYEVGIHVRYEGGDTALVRVTAYDS
ncbi:hypothetical protein KV205_16635 [Streptomyces sp. SKN60]|uniref:hypothetical protein n=1 Tax=Streptomyces sp. SKN60 TaxID=2855506 RepID=UPI002245B7F7|nr:hypothetical protein [Streptomyces sp. SKN60]MCX2182144.1 hypothetical protein [Streptomyces sp. SKN60]